MAIAAILVFALLGFAVVGTLLYVVGIYNGLITVKNNIDKSWANIDVLLNQRSDELPNLVACVEGYMKHEQGVLEGVTKARTAFLNAHSVGEKAQASDALSGALKSLFAVSENYPQLRATENFQHLQSRISGLENEIADRREFFNDSVNTFNIRIEQIPDVIIARSLGMTRREPFKASAAAKEPYRVQFAQSR